MIVCLNFLRREREVQNKLCALPHCRYHLDVTPEGSRNVFADGQAETNAISIQFSMIHNFSKCTEEIVHLFSGNTDPRVFNNDA